LEMGLGGVSGYAMLEPPPPPPSLTMLVNGTADTSDDMTVLDPPQAIPIQVTLSNASGEVQLSVPSGRASLSPSSLSLTDGEPATVTLTPQAVSQSVNDVQIIATYNGAQVAQAPLTIVNVTLPAINNANTPQGMPNRIPPRATTQVQVTVAPSLTGSNQKVTLATSGTSANNGDFTINGGSTLDIQATSSINLVGTTQTAATGGSGGGYAGNLALVARVREQDALTSAGFSVAAIPLNFTDVFYADHGSTNPHMIGGVPHVGVAVQDGWSSDSGDNADLNQVYIAEQVQTASNSGVFSGTGGLTSGYLRADESSIDFHGVAAYYLTGVGMPPGFQRGYGTLEKNQTSMFRDYRTGAVGIPMTNSGFKLTHTVGQESGTWTLWTYKWGADVTANGIRSSAGDASITDMVN
jgi:hypothetical protein